MTPNSFRNHIASNRNPRSINKQQFNIKQKRSREDSRSLWLTWNSVTSANTKLKTKESCIHAEWPHCLLEAGSGSDSAVDKLVTVREVICFECALCCSKSLVLANEETVARVCWEASHKDMFAKLNPRWKSLRLGVLPATPVFQMTSSASWWTADLLSKDFLIWGREKNP